MVTTDAVSGKMNADQLLNGICAVIFDLDGTLVDSMWMWDRIDEEYLGARGIPVPEGLKSRLDGMSFHEIAVYFKETFSLPDSAEEIGETWNEMAYEKYRNEVPLKPGVKSFLSYCVKQQILLGIATSNSKTLTDCVLDSLGVRSIFDSILTGTDQIKGKPAPDIYLRSAEALRVSPTECLVFEDILPGVQAAKSAGMRVCAVADSYARMQKDELLRLADAYITDYTCLPGAE